MFKALFNVIIGVITNLIKTLWAPLDSAINLLFPDISSFFDNFNTFINTYITNNIAYFGHLIPPITKSVILIWFVFLVAYYTFSVVYANTVKIFELIQKIKFW